MKYSPVALAYRIPVDVAVVAVACLANGFLSCVRRAAQKDSDKQNRKNNFSHGDTALQQRQVPHTGETAISSQLWGGVIALVTPVQAAPFFSHRLLHVIGALDVCTSGVIVKHERFMPFAGYFISTLSVLA
ncbi:MAG: hypothetical protein PHX43_02300 [Alphaproteobacteria bacterium]|nr:hypothetical protein [Alphaproteobacteria bacterium]